MYHAINHTNHSHSFVWLQEDKLTDAKEVGADVTHCWAKEGSYGLLNAFLN